MRLYHHHSAVPSLLQCGSTTNVTIVVQLRKSKKKKKYVSNYREFRVRRGNSAAKFRGRGKTEALAIVCGTY